jgi:hypothetical protein
MIEWPTYQGDSLHMPALPGRTKPPYGEVPSQWDLRTLTKVIGPHLADEGPPPPIARIA